MKKLLPLGLVLATVLTGIQAHAASGTWNAAPTDGNWAASGGENNWSTGANTSPGATGTSDTATFVSSTTDTININSASINISGITFGSGSSALSSFTIGTTGGSALNLTGNGNITFANGTTSSGITETINAPLNLKGSYTLSNANVNSTNVIDFGGAISSGTNTAVTATLTGVSTAANTVSGNISDGTGTVSVTKASSGTWILSGSNSYSGITTVGGGNLVVTNAHGLGSNTTAAAITLSGRGAQLSLLSDTTGTTTFGPGSGYNVTQTQASSIYVDHNTSADTGGTIQLGTLTESSGLTVTNGDGYSLNFAGGAIISGSPTITNNMVNGTLTFAGGITDTDTTLGKTITFSSANSTSTTVVAGISPGSGTNTLSLVQAGPGTLELTAASTYNGSTTIWGGNLVLANSTGAAVNTTSLTFDGGALSDIGSSTTAPVFASGTTTFTAGSNSISTGTATGHVLALGALARTVDQGVVNFAPSSTSTGTAGSITTSTGTNSLGILGGWATITTGGVTNWATVNGTTITALTNYTTLPTSGTGTTTNYQLTSGSGTTTLTGNLNLGSLKITDTGTTSQISTGADTLTIAQNSSGAGGLLVTGGGSFTITGTGAVGSGNSGGSEFIVDVTAGTTLTINNPVNSTSIGSSGFLTKAGTGTLILTAANSGYIGGTNIDAGVLQVSTLANTGTLSSIGNSGNILLNGGTLVYAGATASTNRSFVLGANGGEIDSSGSGPLTITTATITSSNSYPAEQINLTLGGSNTAANTITGNIANGSSNTLTGLIKTGAGTWVLSGSNGYTGSTTVNSGTLSVTGTINASSAVAVNGGTLSVGGSVAGPITVAHGGTLSGNGTIGALTLAGGGVINTEDGAIGTLNGSTLTLNAGGGNAVLDLDLAGSQTADLLNFSGVASMSNDFTVNINGLTGAGTGTYTIATAAGGGLLASDFTAGTVGGTLSSGDTMSFVLSGNSIELVISSGSVTSTNYYFTGTNSGSFTDAGNYFTAATGGSQQSGSLSSTSNVFLNANSASNTPDTLSGSASINSLNFVTAGSTLAGNGTVTLAATGTAGITDSAGVAGQTETVNPDVILGSNQSWVATANSTLNVTGTISGAQSLALTGNGTYKLGGANTFQGLTVGTGSDTPTLYLTNGSNGSATGTTTLRVNAGATLAGNGTSSGTSFNISGTSTSARANVLVGLTSAADTTVGNILTLKGSTGTSTIADANLTFNISATSTASNQLSVGTTAIAFGTDAGSVKFSLNLQGEPAIVPNATTYTLIAGTASVDQYTGLTLGAVTNLGNGATETIITGNNLQVAFGNSTDTSYYGNGSYLVLYQAAGVDDIDVVVVPEPGTWAMMLGGLALLVVVQRARRKNS